MIATELTGIKMDSNLSMSLQDLLDQDIQKWIDGKTIRKVIVV